MTRVRFGLRFKPVLEQSLHQPHLQAMLVSREENLRLWMVAEAFVAKSFVYGQIASARSSPPPTESTAASLKRTRSVSRPHGTSRTYWEEDKLDLSNAIGTTANQISWLSDHHRTLFDHFANETIVMFHDSQTIQKEIKNILLPLATNTNHGFSLLAAIISLAATHQTNVGRSVDEAEIEYWRDMSIGHLRRPGVHE